MLVQRQKHEWNNIMLKMWGKLYAIVLIGRLCNCVHSKARVDCILEGKPADRIFGWWRSRPENEI